MPLWLKALLGVTELAWYTIDASPGAADNEIHTNARWDREGLLSRRLMPVDATSHPEWWGGVKGEWWGIDMCSGKIAGGNKQSPTWSEESSRPSPPEESSKVRWIGWDQAVWGEDTYGMAEGGYGESPKADGSQLQDTLETARRDPAWCQTGTYPWQLSLILVLFEAGTVRIEKNFRAT